jgi:aromatase
MIRGGIKMGLTINEIWINRDIDTVFDVTNQIDRWKDLFSEYQESTIISRDGNKIKFKLTTYPDENGRIKSWVSERVINKENYNCEAVRIDPKFPFSFMIIYWEYKSQKNGTLMKWVQKFETDPDSKMTDKQLEEYLNKNTKIQMSVIKEKIENGFY